MIDYLALAREVGDIAREAGAAILKVYESDDFGVAHKTDNSPLTRADQAANAVIIAGLQQLEFQAPVISEENAEVPFEQRRHYKCFWLVDPLDGTKEFIKRNGDFTVNIALIEGESPLLGVVYTPVTDELVFGVIGQGAYLQGKPDQRLEAANFHKEDPGLKVVASRSHLNAATQAFMDELRQPEIISRGSSLKIIELAKGKAHLYPRLAPTMEWDTAAAQAVLEAAGGSLLDYETGQPLRYNKKILRNPHFVAAGKMQTEA